MGLDFAFVQQAFSMREIVDLNFQPRRVVRECRLDVFLRSKMQLRLVLH